MNFFKNVKDVFKMKWEEAKDSWKEFIVISVVLSIISMITGIKIEFLIAGLASVFIALIVGWLVYYKVNNK